MFTKPIFSTFRSSTAQELPRSLRLYTVIHSSLQWHNWVARNHFQGVPIQSISDSLRLPVLYHDEISHFVLLGEILKVKLCTPIVGATILVWYCWCQKKGWGSQGRNWEGGAGMGEAGSLRLGREDLGVPEPTLHCAQPHLGQRGSGHWDFPNP